MSVSKIKSIIFTDRPAVRRVVRVHLRCYQSVRADMGQGTSYI